MAAPGGPRPGAVRHRPGRGHPVHVRGTGPLVGRTVRFPDGTAHVGPAVRTAHVEPAARTGVRRVRPRRLRRPGPGPCPPGGRQRPAGDGHPLQRVVQTARPVLRAGLAEVQAGRRLRHRRHAPRHLRRGQAGQPLRRPPLGGTARRPRPGDRGRGLVPARSGGPAARALGGPLHQGRTAGARLQHRRGQHARVRPRRHPGQPGPLVPGPAARELGRGRAGRRRALTRPHQSLHPRDLQNCAIIAVVRGASRGPGEEGRPCRAVTSGGCVRRICGWVPPWPRWRASTRRC
ncbi:hypothetical protein SGPA1_50439 [Streptomyces misionensis JCM 4497]